jgi:desulfoferrodoxin (superoxide reductase-like protein)
MTACSGKWDRGKLFLGFNPAFGGLEIWNPRTYFYFIKFFKGGSMKILTTKKLFFYFLFLAVFFAAQTSFANKSSVTISAPETAAKGSEVLIKLTITHSANSYFHYTNWVSLKVNGKEFSRWEFTRDKRPEGAVFSREVKIPVNEPLELIAEANCNIHGSAGPAKWKIAVKE